MRADPDQAFQCGDGHADQRTCELIDIRIAAECRRILCFE